ncbi:MAG: methyltransferase domain-containing protein [Paracoccaceae bacterium]
MDTSAFEEMEQSGWAKSTIAQGYATRFANATKLVADHLSDAVAPVNDRHILDLCTGHGVVASALASRGAKVKGLDFSPAMVALAESQVPDVQFVVGDAMALESDDSVFDAVTIGFGVPHLPDPHAGLAEVARVLKPGGRLAFSIWQGKGSTGGFGWLFEAYDLYGDPAVILPSGPDAHAFADNDFAKSELEGLGFSSVTSSVVAATLVIDAPEHLFDAYDQGAVRAAALLSGQSESRRADVRAHMAENVRAHASKIQDSWHVPVPVGVGSAILD